MKEIQLTRGKVALVDDEDFDFLNQWKWYADIKGNTFYAARRLRIEEVVPGDKQPIIKTHRFIMNPPIDLVIDHINMDGLDNRRCNLRIIPRRENHWNLRTPNRTGFVGVRKNYHKYLSYIRVNNKRYYLGSFPTPGEAHAAYMKKYHEITA